MNGLRVIVVGAGIGGLAAAISLRQAGCEVEVYERAPELLPIGAGICMWPNGAKAANALGLERTLVERSPRLERVRYYDIHGALQREMLCAPLIEASGARPYALARADLHDALLEKLGDVPLHLGCECVGVDQDAQSVSARFADGSEAAGDLLVGSDGVKSVVRDHVAGALQLRYHYSTWVAILPRDPALTSADTFSFYTGTDQRVGVLPVSDGRMYVFFDAPVEEEEEGGPGKLFAGWKPAVAELADDLDRRGATRLPIYDLDPPATFVRDRVALIGDAAHPTTPTLGQGGALAMEDAIVLTRYLQSTTVSVQDALARYDEASRRRATPIVLAARARANSMVRGETPDAEPVDEIVRGGSRPEAFVEVLAAIANTGPMG